MTTTATNPTTPPGGRESCSDGEDLQFLAHCALAKDFSLLIDGVVRPEYLSSAGEQVAHWLMQRHRQSRGSTSLIWPPSYDVIREHHPDMPWPAAPEDITGIDPRFSARHVLYSAKSLRAAHLMATAQQLASVDIGDERATALVSYGQGLVDAIREISNPSSRPRLLFADATDATNRLLGVGTHAQTKDFEFFIPALDRALAPFYSGLYLFFARPKTGKSWLMQMAAHHQGITRGHRTYYVDPENSREEILGRHIAIQAKLDYAYMRDTIARKIRGEMLTDAEHDVLDQIVETGEWLQNHGNLYVIGKEAMDPGTGRISLEYVMDMARDENVDVIFFEQTHKIGTATAKKNEDEWAQVRRIHQILAGSEFLIIGTTQEKRAEKARAAPRVAQPDGDMVFGGDGALQNCTFAAHLAKYDAGDGSLLLQITPVAGRNMSPAAERPLFIRAKYCTMFEMLDYDAGLVMAETLVQQQVNEREAIKKRAAAALKGATPQAAGGRDDANHIPLPSPIAGDRAVTRLLRHQKS